MNNIEALRKSFEELRLKVLLKILLQRENPAGGRINEYPHSVYPIDRNGYGL